VTRQNHALDSAADRHRAPELAEIASAFEDAGVPVLVLRGRPGDRDTTYAWDEHTIDIMVAKAHVDTALRLIEPMSWRYAWARTGTLRLLPIACASIAALCSILCLPTCEVAWT
jgi:hypothetical protein